MTNSPRLIVSGLHRGENPQPGAGIVQSIRRAFPKAHIVGLVYDLLESGIYFPGGVDRVYAMPFPRAGAETYLRRLDEVLAEQDVDTFIPTLDAEIELLAHLKSDLAQRGLKVILPSVSSLDARAKQHLPRLAERTGAYVPKTLPVFSVAEAQIEARALGFPLMVKGQYYEAKRVHSALELGAAVEKLLIDWGAPALLQEFISGPEFNVLGLGDGKGRVIGSCSLRKTVVSSQGKGLGGMTVRDPRLTGLTHRLIQELKWEGPFEVELMLDERKKEYALIEINPRFPAWVDFPSQCGTNFVLALLTRLESGVWPDALEIPDPGHFYLRHQIEVHGHVNELAELCAGA